MIVCGELEFVLSLQGVSLGVKRIFKQSKLSYYKIFMFFWPLAVTSVLMGLSSSIVNAGLSRSADSISAIATFSVAYVVAVFLNSPIYSSQQTSIVLINGKNSFKRVHFFLLVQGIIVFLFQVLVIVSPIGKLLFETFIGVDSATSELALKCMIVWLPFSIIIGWRGLFQALLIKNKKTFLISVATAVRIAAMILVILFLPKFIKISGALVGAFSITVSIFVEVVIIFLSSIPYIKELKNDNDKIVSAKGFIKFSVPLSLSMLLWTAAGFLLNTIVAHSTDKVEALAIMAIAYNSIGWFFAAPAKALLQCTLTLVKNAYTAKKVKNFSIYLLLGSTLFMLLLILPGIFDYVFTHIFVIKNSLHSYLKYSIVIAMFYPLAIGIRNYIQGNLIRNKLTAAVSYASVGRLALLIIVAIITKIYPLNRGAIYGILILVGSVYIENFILWIYSKKSNIEY